MNRRALCYHTSAFEEADNRVRPVVLWLLLFGRCRLEGSMCGLWAENELGNGFASGR
ncbi:hypothetical protein BDW66DRAFT_129400 [Aspergillus desertorum]